MRKGRCLECGHPNHLLVRGLRARIAELESRPTIGDLVDAERRALYAEQRLADAEQALAQARLVVRKVRDGAEHSTRD